MPDLTPDQVRAQLTAVGLVPSDDDDLIEISHRINAVNEAVDALDHPDLERQEPLPVFPYGEEP